MASGRRVQLELTTPTTIIISPKMYLVGPAVSNAVMPCVHDGMTFNLGMVHTYRVNQFAAAPEPGL